MHSGQRELRSGEVLSSITRLFYASEYELEFWSLSAAAPGFTISKRLCTALDPQDWSWEHHSLNIDNWLKALVLVWKSLQHFKSLINRASRFSVTLCVTRQYNVKAPCKQTDDGEKAVAFIFSCLEESVHTFRSRTWCGLLLLYPIRPKVQHDVFWDA